jgi:hypothetical protein
LHNCDEFDPSWQEAVDLQPENSKIRNAGAVRIIAQNDEKFTKMSFADGR